MAARTRVRPPVVSASDADAAIASIRQRRIDIDDPQVWRLTDDPVEVLAYLRRYSTGLPAEVARADVLDGLTLRMRLWWIEQEATLWLLEQAQRHRISPDEIGPRLGLSTRQGVYDRLGIVRARVGLLRGTPVPGARPPAEDSGEAEWLKRHRDEVLAAAAEAAAYRDLVAGDAVLDEWLRDAGRYAAEGHLTPGTFVEIRDAIADLGTADPVRALPDGHPVHDLLDRWRLLLDSHDRTTPTTR